MFIQNGTYNSLYTSTFLLQYLQDKTGLVDALLPSPPQPKSGLSASATVTRAQAKRLNMILSDVSITTLGYIFMWVWLLHPKLIHFSLQEMASSSSESLVTRSKNPHQRKLDMTTSNLTTEISSDLELEVVQVSLISGDTVVA